MSGCLTVRLLGITGGLKGANEQQELLRKYRRSPSGKGGSLEASRKTDTVLGTRINNRSLRGNDLLLLFVILKVNTLSTRHTRTRSPSASTETSKWPPITSKK